MYSFSFVVGGENGGRLCGSTETQNAVYVIVGWSISCRAHNALNIYWLCKYLINSMNDVYNQNRGMAKLFTQPQLF